MLSRHEQWADNSALYQKILERRDGHYLEKAARETLALYARFPPGELHDRLVAHTVTVYEISDIRWVHHGKQLVVPNGTLEHKVTVDLGNVLVQMAGKEAFVEEEIARNVLHPLPDGTFIRGTTYRRVPREEALSQLQEYVAIDFDDHDRYSFALRKDALCLEKPPEFELAKYVRIEGEIIEEKRQLVQAAFQKLPSGSYPMKFKRWVKRAISA